MVEFFLLLQVIYDFSAVSRLKIWPKSLSRRQRIYARRKRRRSQANAVVSFFPCRSKSSPNLLKDSPSLPRKSWSLTICFIEFVALVIITKLVIDIIEDRVRVKEFNDCFFQPKKKKIAWKNKKRKTKFHLHLPALAYKTLVSY